MYAWFYQGSPLVVFPLVALFLFIAVFIAVLIRTFGMHSYERYRPLASLPLSDEATPVQTTTAGERHV